MKYTGCWEGWWDSGREERCKGGLEGWGMQWMPGWMKTIILRCAGQGGSEEHVFLYDRASALILVLYHHWYLHWSERELSPNAGKRLVLRCGCCILQPLAALRGM